MREAEMADLKKQAEEIKSSVSDLASFNPMANTQKEIESAFEMADTGATAARAEPTPAATEPQQLEAPTPLPELPPPSDDLATTEVPPPKQAGGNA